MAVNVIIPYKPRIWSKEFHETSKRWIVLVIHRRAGKTTAALNHLQRDALKTPSSRWAYISPTYKQSKNIAWDLLKQYSKVIPGIEYNEAELTVRYPNGSKLTLYGADNPDSLRGIGLWGVVFDEYSQQPSNIFTEIIRPALADHSGYAIWIGTPKGKNEFYRLYAGLDEKGGQKEDLKDWLRILLTVDHTKEIKQEELVSAEQTMSHDEYLQEWYCSFEASIKGSVYGWEINQMREENRIVQVPYDKSVLVHTVCDLGKGRNMALGFYQRAYGQLRKIDFWEGSGDEAIPDMIKVIKEKPYVYGKHFAPHDIKAVDLSTGVSRIETAKTLGIKFTEVPDIGLLNGIHATKLMFSRMWADKEKCKYWLDAISQYHYEWDDNRGAFKDTPYHDWTSHAADETRYAAVVENQMTNESDENINYNWEVKNLDPYAQRQ